MGERPAFLCMLYDREDYAGERAPESVMSCSGPRYRGPRYRVTLVSVDPKHGWMSGTLFALPAETRDAALAMVPPGGRHSDRTNNYPSSPMVPTDSWAYDAEPAWRERFEEVRHG